MIAMINASHVIFEIEDNYQKQTYRNRTYIAHSNGKLLLNIPIKHTKDGFRQKTKEVRTDNTFPWQSQHWKSLQSAYRTSPYFEFYEDDLKPIFTEMISSLLEINMRSLKCIFELLELNIPFSYTKKYETSPDTNDLRYLVNAKSEVLFPLEGYTQVLGSKHGFLTNLSVLDLIFNEGPNAVNYLERQKVDFTLSP